MIEVTEANEKHTQQHMEYRPLGQTGLQVSRVGLGTAALGRPGYMVLGHAQDMDGNYSIAAMEARTHEMLNEAYAAGIRYFDTARSYGRGEEFLGHWLARRQPPQAITGSKWGYTYTANWQVQAEVHEVKDHTLPVLERQWAESQENLGSSLHLYQIHSATLESGVLERADVLAHLQQLKHSHGVAMGLSLSSPRQAQVLEKAMAVQVDGERLFDAVQGTFNLLEPSAGPTLEAAHQEGMGVVIKEAFANGRLTSRNPEKELPAALEKITGLSPDATSLAWILQHPWVDVVLSGAVLPSQLHSNLSGLGHAFTQAQLEAIGQLAESCEEYWQKRSTLAWN